MWDAVLLELTELAKPVEMPCLLTMWDAEGMLRACAYADRAAPVATAVASTEALAVEE